QLLAAETVDQAGQPGQARVVRVIVIDRGRLRLHIRMEFGEQALALRVVEFASVEYGEIRNAPWKPADLGTAVAEHDAPGAVPVDERIDEALRVAGFVADQRLEF